MDLSGYTLAVLHQGGELLLCRGRAMAGPTPYPTSVLVSIPASEHPNRIRMLERELALRAELDSTWAVRPLALAQYQGRTALILEDQRGEPVGRLLDKPQGSRTLGVADPAVDLGL